ncbi:MAG: hypothetical protein KGM24_00295, partial [Elusimicrobia bacterium]|nr:hypothetical protein [Elusimicrobiota bacterium]
AAPRRAYVLSRPLRETVSLGPVALGAHAVCGAGWESLKIFLGWKAGGWGGALGVGAVELPFAPLMATGRSLAHLGLLYWRRKLAVLRGLARTPGVETIRVLTTARVEFWGPFARRMENVGLIFVETSAEPPAELGRFGAPIPLGDVAGRRLRLTLHAESVAAAAVWTPTLAGLLAGREIPAGVAEAWRGALSAARPASPLGRLLAGVSSARNLRVRAELLDADGSATPLGEVATGPAALKLIGLGPLDRLRTFLHRPLPARAVPISRSDVERPDAARPRGALARLRRAWRRLTGRLIVARG